MPKPKARPAPEPEPPALFPGDTVEYAMSVELNLGGSKHWPRFAVTSKVQDGETPEEAKARISGFVVEQVASDIEELKRG